MRIGLLLLLSLWASAASGQCVTTCAADAPKDDNGCCIEETASAGETATGDNIKPCPKGKERSQYTAGHCCWPNQEWSQAEKKCTGTANCPEGLVASGDDCQCAEGKSVTDFTAGQCCWPNQEWSKKTNQCMGPPKCPSRFEKDGNDCKKIVYGILNLIVTGGKECLFTLQGRRIRPYAFNSIREEVAVGTYEVGCVREGYASIIKTVTVTAEGKKVLFKVR